MTSPSSSNKRPAAKPTDNTNILEVERSVLGAILLDNHALQIVLDKLKPEHFLSTAHARILKHMMQMGNSNEAIDVITLNDHLRLTGELEAAGGPAELAGLIDGVPRISNVQFYCEIVKEQATLRQVVHLSQGILQDVLQGHVKAADVLERGRSAFISLSDSQIPTGLLTMRALIETHTPQIDKLFNANQQITGLTTGYSQLDRLTAGLQPCELIVLAARPSVGKTSCALNIAENIAKRGDAPIAIFSLEMSVWALMMRLLSSASRIDAHRFRTGHISHDDAHLVAQTLGEMMNWPIAIDDSAAASVLDIAVRASRMKREAGLALIIVDYLQLLSPSHRKYSNRRHEDVAEITRDLKAVAKDLAVPVLALSQLTRMPEREDRRPQLSDLRESGELEQSADTVLFIHRPHLFKTKGEVSAEEKSQTELIIAKQRNGPTDIVPFVFLEKYTRFEEAVAGGWNESINF